ncbi:hypothetical protein D3C78_1543740 [compost metagenome]
MPAERAADRLAVLPGLQRVEGALEFRHRVAGVEPAQIAAERGAAVLGELACHRFEAGAALQTVLHLQDARLGFRFRGGFVGLDQDVAHLVLLHQLLACAVALVGQLEQEQAAVGAHDVGDVADLHAVQQLDEVRRQRAGAFPAHVAAAERGGGF